MFSGIYQALFGPKINDSEEFIRMTYRNNIHKLMPTTNYTSDAGWGCMLRVMQMAVANLLIKKDGAELKSIVSLFWDNSDMPFSIQTITSISSELFPYKKPKQWFTPSEAGFLIQATLEKFNLTYRVAVCNDGSVFLNQIPRDRENVVVLAMARIGLDKPEPEYLSTLMKIMDCKYFFAILGGTPKYAHLFFKHKQNYLGMLDPHETKKAAETEEDLVLQTDEYFGKLEWVRIDKISSSMCIMFTMKRNEIDDFWKQMLSIKEKSAQSFFLYLAEERPDFSNDDLIEIIQLE